MLDSRIKINNHVLSITQPLKFPQKVCLKLRKEFQYTVKSTEVHYKYVNSDFHS